MLEDATDDEAEIDTVVLKLLVEVMVLVLVLVTLDDDDRELIGPPGLDVVEATGVGAILIWATDSKLSISGYILSARAPTLRMYD